MNLLNIQSKLNRNFLSRNLDYSTLENFNTSLSDFQHELLKSRNYECAASIDFKSNSDLALDNSRWRSILSAWEQLNSNVDSDSNVETIINGLDEMVK